MLTQTSNNQISSPLEAHQLLLKMVHHAKINFVQMGAVLKYLKEGDNFKLTTGGIDTWEEYVRQPEISLSNGESNRLIQIYEVFCEKFGYTVEKIASVPVKNLHYLLPIAKESDDKEEIDRLVTNAELLTQKDFRDRVFEMKTDGPRTYEYYVMEKCIETGNMKRVYDIPEQDIRTLIIKYNTEIEL